MTYLLSRVVDWMTYEPVIGSMMVVASVVLFLGAYRRGEPPSAFWAWFRKVVEAGGTALLFLGMLWAFRAVLNDNSSTFAHNHGRVSEANYESVKTIWGRPHVQRELEVAHHRRVIEREETWRDDPSLPPLFRNVERDVVVQQNSIVAAHGVVNLQTNERRKGSALYSGFDGDFAMTYTVRNDSAHRTRAQFSFPLSGQVLYDDLAVTENGEDISRDLRFTHSGIHWKRGMDPGETVELHISYGTRGVEYFYYQIPEPREIRDFTLTMNVDGLPLQDVNYPERCLTPHHIEEMTTGTGTVLSWTLDRAVSTAGMGVALPKPTQPGAKVSLVLRNSPYALMLLVVAVALTLLVRGEEASLLDLSMLSATYCVLFLTMASASDYLIGFWGSLSAGAALTLGMAWLLFRRHPARVPILVLTTFFTAIYPLSGLLPEHQDAVDGGVAVALVVYLFSVSLAARLSMPNGKLSPTGSGVDGDPAQDGE